MALAWIPRDEPPAAGRKIAEVATRIDLGGIALFGGMLAALLVFLMSLPHPDWAPSWPDTIPDVTEEDARAGLGAPVRQSDHQ